MSDTVEIKEIGHCNDGFFWFLVTSYRSEKENRSQ